MTSTYDRIAFFGQPSMRLFLIALAEQLKQRHWSEIHLYCYGPQQVQYYKNIERPDLFASINDADILLPNSLLPVEDEAAEIARACAFEEKTGLTYNWLAIASRHLGRGYALGAPYFPRSPYSENSSYVQMLRAYNETLAYWECELSEKDITLIVNGTRESAIMGRLRGIPTRFMIESRYKNYRLWTHDEYDMTPEIEAAFQRTTIDDSEVATIDEPYMMHRVHRERFFDEVKFPATLKAMAYLCIRQIYWRVRRYEKAKGYYLKEVLQHRYRTWHRYKHVKKICDTSLAELKGKPFVYFPLHYEPERALQGLSPEYFYQHSLIAAVSRDLPAGVMLAVKEQFSSPPMRPDNFYRQIKDLKNVVLVEMMELGLDIVPEASAVVTICGTSGLEAAVMGKPVISFGRHNQYNFLPHVRVITDESTLKADLREALDGTIDQVQARIDGRRFLEAVVKSSFDMRSYNRFFLDSFDQESVEDAYRTLIRSLEFDWTTEEARKAG
jgi:hypothetical protein